MPRTANLAGQKLSKLQNHSDQRLCNAQQNVAELGQLTSKHTLTWDDDVQDKPEKQIS